MKQLLDETPVWVWLIAGLIGLGLAAYANEVAALVRAWQLGLRGTIWNPVAATCHLNFAVHIFL